ncbi:MAG: phospholipid/cholesterol/gamma-HCH transport system substrate-binding protein [Actinomycetota bacterium]|nr:phospholipid/cholesterol/gamma-HCH transport system substrate-binding protein [Actinomycetota bacterium]
MRKYAILALVAATATALVVAFVGGSSYTVKVVLGSATNLVVGGTVEVKGFKAGSISALGVESGKAVVTLHLDRGYAPLHDGAVVTVDWKALLGERIVDVVDGPKSNGTIPDNGMIAGKQADPVELDQVLNTLDPATRQHLSSAVKSLSNVLNTPDATTDLKATITSAGPALHALGEVLRAVGTDGPAIRDLVTRMNTMVGTLSAHDSTISNVVDELTKLADASANQRASITATLKLLPSTLDAATTTLGHIPGVVDKANPLLKDLAPVTAKLPGVARNLKPVLADLRPVAAQLRPTLAAASQLLTYTPGLLDTADATVPGIDATITYLEPVLAFLRPYTPELQGFLSNWASAFAGYNANGHYARFLAQAGPASVDNNPGIMPPGVTNDPYPLPGANVGQPWSDAFGSGVH